MSWWAGGVARHWWRRGAREGLCFAPAPRAPAALRPPTPTGEGGAGRGPERTPLRGAGRAASDVGASRALLPLQPLVKASLPVVRRRRPPTEAVVRGLLRGATVSRRQGRGPIPFGGVRGGATAHTWGFRACRPRCFLCAAHATHALHPRPSPPASLAPLLSHGRALRPSALRPAPSPRDGIYYKSRTVTLRHPVLRKRKKDPRSRLSRDRGVDGTRRERGTGVPET